MHSPLLFFPALSFLVAAFCSAIAAEGVIELNLPVRGLVYDPSTEKLYATSARTNNLLQIDPLTGTVLKSFEIGGTPSRVELAAGPSLWIGLDGQGALRRFNLSTLAAEETIVVRPGAAIYDIAPSAGDPHSVVVATSVGAYLIRNAQVLPDSVGMTTVALSGASVYGQSGLTLTKANVITSGLSWSVGSIGTRGFGDAEVVGDYVYHSSGNIFRSSDLLHLGMIGPSVVPVRMKDVTLNKDRDELLYLSEGPSWVVYRFNRDSRVQTGEAAFGEGDIDITYADLQAWGTNRAAFHSSTNLYLLDLDKLFLPADLAVTQSVGASSLTFATNATVSVTVTNKGPGPALAVVLTNYIETFNGSAAHFRMPMVEWLPVDPTSVEPVRTDLGVIPAGEARTFEIRFLTGTPGMLMNRVAVFATNESKPEDNTDVFTVPVTTPSDGVIRLPFVAGDIASDPGRGILWVYAQNRLWSVDSVGPRISVSPGVFPNATRIATAPQSGEVYVGFHDLSGHDRAISRVPGGSVVWGNGPILDLEVSPADSQLLAVSQNTGTRLFRGSEQLPNTLAGAGYLGFSADGTKVYRSHFDSCDLSIYTLGSNGPTLERTLPNVACGEFSVVNGILYFENGVIFDPASGTRLPNSPVVSAPAFLLPRAMGAVDIFSRTNDLWTVRRYRRETTNFVQFAQSAFPGITEPISEASQAGPDGIALRTGAEVILLNLPGDPNAITTAISVQNGQTIVRFASAVGSIYRVEGTTQLRPAEWIAAAENLVGTGDVVSQRIHPTNRTGFYRIVRLP